jgi:hypothetical protein
VLPFELLVVELALPWLVLLPALVLLLVVLPTPDDVAFPDPLLVLLFRLLVFP